MLLASVGSTASEATTREQTLDGVVAVRLELDDLLRACDAVQRLSPSQSARCRKAAFRDFLELLVDALSRPRLKRA